MDLNRGFRQFAESPQPNSTCAAAGGGLGAASFTTWASTMRTTKTCSRLKVPTVSPGELGVYDPEIRFTAVDGDSSFLA